MPGRMELLRQRPRPNILNYEQGLDNGQLIDPLVLLMPLHTKI